MGKRLAFVTLVLIVVASMDVSAGGGSAGGGPVRKGRLVCQVVDKGWEEHYGGHSSCAECLGEHGDCEEKCYDESYQCEAQGRDRSGLLQKVSGYSPISKTAARARAMDECYYAGLQGCTVSAIGCDTISDLVSIDRCVRPQPRPERPTRPVRPVRPGRT